MKHSLQYFFGCFFCLCNLFICCAPSFAQQTLQIEALTTQQGLHSRHVQAVLQDKYGFLWFATEQGAFRWDGVSMTQFLHESGNVRSLPSSNVLHLHEDKQGRLWLGTASGLARLNRNTNTFQRFFANKPIADIHEDRSGKLWCWIHTAAMRTDEIGILEESNQEIRITASKEVRKEIILKAGEKGLRSAYLYAFLHDSHGTLWLGTANGLHRYSPETGVCTPFLSDATSNTPAANASTANASTANASTANASIANTPTAHIHSLQEMSNGELLIGTGKGLFHCAQPQAAGNLAIQPFTGANSTTLLRESGIIMLEKDSTGNVFAGAMRREGTVNTIVWVDVQRGTMSEPLPVLPLEGKAQSHRTALDANNGHIYWGVGNGAIRLNTAQMHSELLLADAAAPTRLHAGVAGACVSKAGKIWFARTSSGVSALLPPPPPFAALTKPLLLAHSVSAIAEAPDGAMWIGYMNGTGVSLFNPRTQAISHLRTDARNPSSLLGFDGETNIYAFCSTNVGTRRGAWWVGGFALERRISDESGANTRFEHTLLFNNQALPVSAMLEDADGNFWIGTHSVGLFLLDAAGNVVKQFTNKPSNTESLGNNTIHTIIQDRAKMLWIGHEGGVDTFDPKRKMFRHFRAYAFPTNNHEEETEEQENLSNTAASGIVGAVHALLCDSKGRVWIGSEGGVSCFDPATQALVRHFSTRTGLPNNAIAGIVEDGSGNIWVSTRRGVCRISEENMKGVEGSSILTFTRASGLADDEFSNGAATRSRDGKLWFGGRSAIVYFHPDSIIRGAVNSIRSDVGANVGTDIGKENTSNKAVMTYVKKFGEITPLEEYIADAERIELGYADKIIAFGYAAPSMLYPEHAQFAYKLEGLDTAYILAGTEREAKYTSLPDGEYTFFVKAADHNGVWQNRATALRVIVRPPWWRAWWFLAGSSILTLLAAFLLYKRRIRTIELRNQELTRLVDERTHQLKEANIEVHRQLEILDEQAQEIEISNTRLQETNLQLDSTLNELKDTQTQLVQSERINAAGMLTAGVMHEINNPNASIHSAVELGQQQLRSLEQYFFSLLDAEGRASKEAAGFTERAQKLADILHIALTGSERIGNIVTSLQGFTKHQHVGKTRNDVAAEVRSTATMFRYQFKDIVVEEQLPSHIHVKAQWDEINQAMLNLLVNAAQAGATRIRIAAELSDGSEGAPKLIFSVHDNGKGMDAETQKHIFEPFFTTKSVGNSGLGLSITRQIIERHHGEITVESTPGQGTTFTITLPQKNGSADATAETQTETQAETQAGAAH